MIFRRFAWLRGGASGSFSPVGTPLLDVDGEDILDMDGEIIAEV
jgi:hypothetical protein